MKKRLLQIGLAAMIAGSAAVHGVENPNVRSSFRSTTTVPSETQGRRFITSPNPPVGGGNDIVTGNVSGMKYFRGIVPYGSSYYTGAPLDAGTSSVDDFLRRSSNPIASDRAPGTVQRYYQQERTTSRFVRPDATTVPGPENAIRTPNNPYVLSVTPQVLESQVRQRPLATDTRQIEELLTRQNLLSQEQFDISKSKLLNERTTEPSKQLEPLPLSPQTLEQLQLPPKQLPEQEIQTEFQKANQEAIEEQKTIRSQRQPFELEKEPAGEQAAPEGQSILPQPQEQAQMAAKGKEIIGEYGSYDALAQARFAAYMQTAESYIKEGKFYKAADVYELASVWQPKNARSYLGKGIALFAAGEYMSSAYYIGRAIELDPALAGRAFSFAGLIGDRDVFENRLVEIAEWQKKSNSGELAFLMAYVLLNDGRTAQATEAIDKAVKLMPDSASAQALHQVIVPQAAP
ncbi:MAG: hypothetical protein LLF76_05700 [Planctomycetaceae bacterium]|nr:hypothetical protein [Planctomycetaceae bacterium]